jgi:hypothetical protein
MAQTKSESRFVSRTLGLAMDTAIPGHGYVIFDRKKWPGLPQKGLAGKCVIYLPLADTTDSHLVTDAMREAVRKFYAAQDAAVAKEKAETEARRVLASQAAAERRADPSHQAAAVERVRLERDYDRINNEGGGGYNPHRPGSEPTYVRRPYRSGYAEDAGL